jgi:hypothetical protein
MSTYLTICNLLFKQEILQKKREVPYGIQEEKRNNANKILNSITFTYQVISQVKSLPYPKDT